MPMWTWIAIGVGSATALSLLVGLVLARILGAIGRGVTELSESEFWLSWEPPRRADADVDAGDLRIVH